MNATTFKHASSTITIQPLPCHYQVSICNTRTGKVTKIFNLNPDSFEIANPELTVSKTVKAAIITAIQAMQMQK